MIVYFHWNRIFEQGLDLKKRVLILGAGVMQSPAIRIAGEMGFETFVVDGNPNAEYAGLAGGFKNIDLKDKEAIAEYAGQLKASGGLDGVFTCGTDFSASVAYVCEKNNLPGISYEAALNASNKDRMRRCFKECGVPSPEFIVFSRESNEQYKLPFHYPVVVKPVDNMGARGCRRADNYAELQGAVREAMEFSASGRVIVEEYLEGPEYSLDAIIYKGEITICGIAERHIRFPPYFIETGHTMPALLDKETEDKIVSVFKAGIKSLGITLGAAKGDIKFTKNGAFVGEIAARLSGGFMSGWTYPYSSGVYPVRSALSCACGEAPEDLTPVLHNTSAERAIISIPGKIREIQLKDSAENILYVRDLFFRVQAGSTVIFPLNNVSKCANVISSAPERDHAVSAAENAVKTVLLRLAAPEAATEAFLQESGDFPPDAFSAGGSFSPKEKTELNAGIEGLAEGSGRAESGVWTLEPFTAFCSSKAVDYAGRTAEESLQAVRKLTGQSLPFAKNGGSASFGREFWKALIRGGYQGAAYTVDKVLQSF
ncbi:MAG: ATP-grasp domain-containing protein [Spirochaetaceae bacterium]|nr:ATP-grasp domain-containing protein [Spirochaetaceae bacterium]